MPSVEEILGARDEGRSQMHDALVAGTAVLSADESATFYPYVRVVLPLDGYIFWMRASLLSPEQLSQNNLKSADPIIVAGSLHYATIGVQDEEQNIVVRKVDFTAGQEVKALGEVGGNVLYVATWGTNLGSFRFTFSSRNAFYQEAELFHYVGDAVYPVFEAQLIDTLAALDDRQIVSNSLPIWLRMVQAVPYPLAGAVTSNIPLFPSYLVPSNLVPPYGAVMIPANSTQPLQPTPLMDRQRNEWQLEREHVRFILFGMRNAEAMDFRRYLIDYQMVTDAFGFSTMPVIRDEHRRQTELVALAQQKVIEFDVNYYQARARDLARQVIKTAVPSFAFNDVAVAPPEPQVVPTQPGPVVPIQH